jgi:hypothetical protein
MAKFAAAEMVSPSTPVTRTLVISRRVRDGGYSAWQLGSLRRMMRSRSRTMSSAMVNRVKRWSASGLSLGGT